MIFLPKKYLLESSLLVLALTDIGSASETFGRGEGLRKRAIHLTPSEATSSAISDLPSENSPSPNLLDLKLSSLKADCLDRTVIKEEIKEEDECFPGYTFAEILEQAKEGYPEAQYALGKCYEEGKGVSRNNKLAFEWHLKAAAQINTEKAQSS